MEVLYAEEVMCLRPACMDGKRIACAVHDLVAMAVLRRAADDCTVDGCAVEVDRVVVRHVDTQRRSRIAVTADDDAVHCTAKEVHRIVLRLSCAVRTSAVDSAAVGVGTDRASLDGNGVVCDIRCTGCAVAVAPHECMEGCALREAERIAAYRAHTHGIAADRSGNSACTAVRDIHGDHVVHRAAVRSHSIAAVGFEVVRSGCNIRDLERIALGDRPNRHVMTVRIALRVVIGGVAAVDLSGRSRAVMRYRAVLIAVEFELNLARRTAVGVGVQLLLIDTVKFRRIR